MVCGHSREEYPCDLPGICTLVYVNQDFTAQGVTSLLFIVLADRLRAQGWTFAAVIKTGTADTDTQTKKR